MAARWCRFPTGRRRQPHHPRHDGMPSGGAAGVRRRRRRGRRCRRRRHHESFGEAARVERRAAAGVRRQQGRRRGDGGGRAACGPRQGGRVGGVAAATLGKGGCRTLLGLIVSVGQASACSARFGLLWDDSQIAANGGSHEASAHVRCDVQKHGCQRCKRPHEKLIRGHMKT